MKNNVDRKEPFKIIFRILLIVVIILSLVVVTFAGTAIFIRWQRDVQEQSGDVGLIGKIFAPTREIEPVVTCLFIGVNGNMTDFIMLGQYDPNNREIDLVSIPRDTYVGKSSVDGKINSLYHSRGFKPENLVKEVEKITEVEIQHYVLFETSILRKVVDEMGGITVDVPINMNYDDPYQYPPLHIHINKGLQVLNGTDAEGFCRFRQNNNGTGYPGGDIERTQTQQKFIKAFISELLKAKNIAKIGTLIGIVVDGTKTDVTLDIAKEYIDDVIALRTDRIYTNTLPGSAGMGDSLLGYRTSFYYLDKEKVKAMIEEMFFNREYDSGDTEALAEASSPSVVVNAKKTGDEIRVELLNAGASSKKLNDLVDKLKENGFYVVKIGNYDTTKTEASRIIDYCNCYEDVVDKLKETTEIRRVEEINEDSNVDFTVLIGPNY